MIFSFHKINKKALIFSAFFLLYTIAIRGQQDTIVVLDSFVITASRLPQPKNSIHTHTISPIVAALAQGTSINDFIQAAPGIFTMSKNQLCAGYSNYQPWFWCQILFWYQRHKNLGR
jgi:hypothetical protein